MSDKKRVESPPSELTTVVRMWPSRPILGPDVAERVRRVPGGPVYWLHVLQQQPAPDGLRLATRKCRKDVLERLQWDGDDVWRAFLALRAEHYRGSSWCQITDQFWLPCDAYALPDYDDGYDPEARIEIYMKFGVSSNGRLLLMVSCHPSG